MGKGRAKRPRPAVGRSTETADLTQRLLRHYAADPEFQQALRHFAERNEDVIRRLAEAEEQLADLSALGKLRLWSEFWPLIEEYHADTEAFASQWGLDRLPERLGIESLHRFCIDRFRTGLNFGALPRAVTDIQDFNRAVLEEFGQPQDQPIAQPIEVHFQGEWQAWDEPQVEARKRMVKEFKALLEDELDRIAVEYEQAGYAFRDTESKWQVEGLEWTYRRLAYRESIDTITNDLPPELEIQRRSVEQAVERIRKRLMLKFPPSKRRRTRV
jgi:hypothetical protein